MADLSLRPREVAPRPLGQLLERLPGARLVGDPATTVRGVTHDSDAVRAGDLYIARAGRHTHGIAHVDAALGNGAVAVLTDPEAADRAATAGARAVVVVDDVRAAMGAASAWVYADPASTLLLFGVTGTNGKTTTVYLLDSALRAAGRRTGLIGTIETRVAGETMTSVRTTPEATDLQALFAVMREHDVDAVAMEVSSHAMALGRVDAVTFDVAAFTNLSQDHLDFHADMADYFEAKAELFSTERARRAVVCIDDEWGRRLAARSTLAVTTTGRDADAAWRRTEDVDDGTAGGRTCLIDPDGNRHPLRCRLIGEVNLANAALAYVTLVVAGVDPSHAQAGIADLVTIPGRMEPIDAGQDFVVLVDYAHTPEAVTTLLADARRLVEPDGRVLVVLGCGGDRDRAKRPLMGAAAAAGADVAWFTNDNPRSEDPLAILAAMIGNLGARGDIVVQPDRRTAIERAVGKARPGDVVVIAGKGHEQGQEIGDRIIPFDDRVVVREALGMVGGGRR
jgi:UDP-N-acetylmuramoyl-L-alanyl-D-glutamate--2,6-diaminopimelate ligase